MDGTTHKNIPVIANACDLYGIVQTVSAKGNLVRVLVFIEGSGCFLRPYLAMDVLAIKR